MKKALLLIFFVSFLIIPIFLISKEKLWRPQARSKCGFA